VWAESDLLREREADSVRANAMAYFQAAVGHKGGKKGAKAFNKWLDDLQ